MRRTVCSALNIKDARTVFPEAYQNAIPSVLILKSCNETYILDIKFLLLSGNIGPFKFIPFKSSLFCATPLKLQTKISRNFVEKTPCKVCRFRVNCDSFIFPKIFSYLTVTSLANILLNRFL